MNVSKRVLNKSLGAFLALCVAAAPMHEVQAGPRTDQASERFERGVELYRAGDVRAAIIEFKRAYSIDPNFRLLFNIAQASAELQDYVAAYRYYERYLKEGQQELSDDRKSLVEAEIARMSSYLGRIKLNLAATDATVLVDGVQVQPQEVEQGEILVGAGRRTLAVTAPGYQRFETILDVAGKDELSVDVDLQSLSPAQGAQLVPAKADVAARTDAAPVKKGMGPVFWAGVGTTAAFGLVTIALGYVTKSAERTNRRVVEQVPTTQAEIDQSARNLRGLALTTDVSLGLTAVAAAVTAVAGVLRIKRRRKKQEPKLRAGVHFQGLRLQGRF